MTYRVAVDKFNEAFDRAEQIISEQCPDYFEICSVSKSTRVPINIMVKIVSAFWEEYFNITISVDNARYANFENEKEFTAFLLQYS